MSDSEDDYMSDKLILQCEKQDVRPGLLFNTTQKRQHELLKKQEENKAKKPKKYHEQEQELREKGLNTAISKDNVGFKLLQKMGFKSGSGLGKSVSGIREPISINIKSNSSGVGREEHVKSIIKEKQEVHSNILKNAESNFKTYNAEKRIFMALQKDYFKAQRICEELDFKMDVVEPTLPYFWTKLTRSKLKEKDKTETSDDSEEEQDQEEEEEEEEKEEEITELNLKEILTYLRSQYSYCIYCGDFVEENEELCPGYFRADHDE